MLTLVLASVALINVWKPRKLRSIKNGDHLLAKKKRVSLCLGTPRRVFFTVYSDF